MKIGATEDEARVSAGLDITVYLVLALIGGIAGAVIANAKNRHAGFWMVLCLLLPPAVLPLLLLPQVKRARAPLRRYNEDSDNLDTF
jgi:hypothetical protein